MKLISLFICIILLILNSCSKSNDIDNIVEKQWKNCSNQNDCIIDFANEMNFEWDTIYFFSQGTSLDYINSKLGFELKKFKDIGDKIIFFNRKEIVFYYEWTLVASEPLEGACFVTDSNNYFKVDKSKAKFKVSKNDKAFILELK